jgi:hypothetical protein
MKATWTTWNEIDLQNLIKLKAEFEEQAARPLMDVIDNYLLDTDEGYSFPRAKLFQAMREHADAVRDALLPFDSGVRRAAESA